MKIIKRLIKYCILKIRLRNKVVFSFSVNIALSSKFEGMNKLHEHSSFCGKMGFGSYLGPNSYVVGNITLCYNFTFVLFFKFKPFSKWFDFRKTTNV